MIVGAGFAGLDAGVKLKEMGMKFTILEKSSRLGGTWWDNQYPGAACDIASHLYSLSYYLNPWWSRAYRLPNLNSPQKTLMPKIRGCEIQEIFGDSGVF